MKKFKKGLLAVLAVTLLGAPILSSCGETTQEEDPPITEQATLESIEITKMPNKVEYVTGETFDPTGMEVTANYSDGTKTVVTDYSYSRLPLETNQTTVTITYRGKTVTVPITVTFVLKITSIEVEERPTKTTYVVGETFDPTGMKITGRRNDNTKVAITDYTYDKTEPLTLADTTVTITYEGLTTTLNITVVEESLERIEVTTNPTKMSYLVGETFDPTGMVVSTVTNKGTKKALEASEYSYDKTEPLTLADTTVTITYQETYTATLTISVSEAQLVEIKVTTQPTKTTYKQGEVFDPTGMVVTAVYEDNSEQAITDYTYDKTGKLGLDDTVITISYAGKTTTVEIVVEPLKDRVFVEGLGTVRVEAEDLDTSKATLRDDFIAAGRTFLEAGDGASGGYNICGYNPGSVFEIPIETEKDTQILIRARMSDTELNYKINDGVQFKLNDEVLTADDVTFTYEGKGDYWNWKEFNIATVDLTPGTHTFSLTAINQRPNLDCFDFYIIKYGDEVAQKTAVDLKVDYSNVKLEYEEGEKFDTTGLVVTAIYNDGTEEVTTDYTIDKTGELVAEDTYVTVSVGDCSVQIPIKVNGPTFRVTEASTHRVEAENVDTSNIVSDGGSFIENSGSVSSNGQNLGHIAGGYVEIPFSTNKAYSLTVNTMFAFPETVMASEKIDKFEIDGVQYDFADIEMGAADGNQYWNYKTITINPGEIQSGLHTFKITFKGGGNYDYFEFMFAEVN